MDETTIKENEIKREIGRPRKYFTEQERKEALRLSIQKSKGRLIYKELEKIYNQQYYQNNKDKRKKQPKRTERQVCEICNRSVLKSNIRKHEKTKKHLNNM